jgi:hypothetical protein
MNGIIPKYQIWMKRRNGRKGTRSEREERRRVRKGEEGEKIDQEQEKNKQKQGSEFVSIDPVLFLGLRV